MSEQYIEPDQIMVCEGCGHFWHPFYGWGQTEGGTTCPTCGSGDLGGFPLNLDNPENQQRLAMLRQRWEQNR